MKILLFGYGNPGRQDDGLGIAFVEIIKAWAEKEGLEGFDFESNYQLNIEDADLIADKDLVIFADASVEDLDDYCISVVDGKAKVTFTTHAASPGYIVQLCEELFQKKPAVYLLHIKGYEWDFSEGLSEAASENLEKAVAQFKSLLVQPEILLDAGKKPDHMCR